MIKTTMHLTDDHKNTVRGYMTNVVMADSYNTG